MRNFLALTLLMLATVLMAEEKNDTTVVVDGHKIVINTEGDKTKVQVFDSLGSRLFKSSETVFVDNQEIERVYVSSPFIPKRRKHVFYEDAFYPTIWYSFGGMWTNLGDGDRDRDHTRSTGTWQFGLTGLNGGMTLDRQRHWAVTYAMQVYWSRQHLRDGYVLSRDASGNTFLPSTHGPARKNYISYSAVKLPVMLELTERVGKLKFSDALGLSVEWRSRVKSKFRFTEDEVNSKIINHLKYRHVGLNLEGRIGFNNVIFSASAALIPLFKTTDGQKYYPCYMGVGIKL